MHSNLLVALLGSSGVGKSSVIRHMLDFNPLRYKYPRPFTTRKLRAGEKEKISVTTEEFNGLLDEKMLFCPNYIYGNWYAPSKREIYNIQKSDYVPIIDWPLNKLKSLKQELRTEIISFYLLPPSFEELERRISIDNRDLSGDRFKSAKIEIDYVMNSNIIGIDYKIINNKSAYKTAVKIDQILRGKNDSN